MATVGFKNLFYAKLIKDDATGVEYGTPKKIGPAITLDVNPTINTTTLYADDAPFAATSSMSQISVEVESAEIEPSVRAELLGQNVDSATGVISAGANDSPPYVAIMGESEKHNGATRYLKLLKCKFSEGQETYNTKGDSPQYTTPRLTGQAVTRAYDGKWKMIADSDNSLSADIISSWYNSVEPASN